MFSSFPGLGRAWRAAAALADRAAALMARELLALLAVEAIGPTILAFALFSLRIASPAVSTARFVPGLSPVYGQGAVWAAVAARRRAIVVHVVSGALLIACGQ